MAWRPLAAPVATFASNDDALAYYRRRCDAVAQLAEAELRAAGLQRLELDKGVWEMRSRCPDHRHLE